jgi:sulfoxide reductase heme-binding subunit YedZ
MLWGASGEPGSFLVLAVGAGTGLDHAIWLSARSMGLVAYALATCTVLVGVATSARAGDHVPGRGFVSDTHRALSLLTVLAVAGHVLLLAFDQYARFSPAALLVPFVSWYRPVWTGFGVLAAYVLLAVYASFYLRSRIGYKAWRTLHYASFAVFVMATVHGLLAGTDSTAVWARWLYVIAVSAVVLAIAYRFVRLGGPRPIWAWEPRAGDIGGARLVLAAGALALGLLLPTAMLANHNSARSSSVQVPASSASSPRSSQFQLVPNERLDDGEEAFERDDDAVFDRSD